MGVLVQPPPATAMPVLAALHGRCFEEAWSARALSVLLATPGAFALLASLDDDAAPEPVGFILCRAAADECEILSIGVLPEARGQGIGRALIVATERQAREQGVAAMFLEVAIDNASAQALYRGCGYAAVGRRPGYYKRGDTGAVDALVLRHFL